MKIVKYKIIFFIIPVLVLMIFLLYLFNKNELRVNEPILSKGMIPVYYDSINKVWKKADKTNKNSNWYDYQKGIWANSIMVNEDKSEKELSKSRQDYMNAKVDTIILYSDILAFYVWIPRYKYTIFNKNFDEIDEQIINIEFEKSTNNSGTVRCSQDSINWEESKKSEICTDIKYNQITNNKSTYTHPAFTFGNIELEGIWVSKFETTGTSEKPTILPNSISLTNQNVKDQYLTALRFNSSTYIEEESIDKLDIHMMKNIEWGAVTYLSQSVYGRCQNNKCEEIYQNNSMGITGRSGGNSAGKIPDLNNHYSFDIKNELSHLTTYGYYTYDNRIVNYDGTVEKYIDGNLGSKSSTTGNIYGVYDMSGGSNEYTMATVAYKDGNIITGTDKNKNSGFNGVIIGDNIWIKNDGQNIPESKYYDLYIYDDSQNNFSRTKLGDATGETRGWYNDYQCFVNSKTPWTKRGCSSIGLEKSGLFYFCSIEGQALSHIGFRTTISVSR